MKKYISFIFILVFFASCFAQENALLWEINKKGYHTSYLFGTIHISDKKVFQFSDKVLINLKNCDAFAGEIILNEADYFKMLPYFVEKDKSKNCEAVFNDKEYKLVEEALIEKMGKEISFLLPIMPPYIVSILLSYPDIETSQNMGAFLDMYLQNKADSLGKILISLESIESQLAYLTSADIETQKQEVLDIVYNKETNDSTTDIMIELYANEDLQSLDSLVSASYNEATILDEQSMIDRNIIQKDGMVKAMKKQSTFTAVGVAHLIGEKGILALLEAEGFTIKPIYK